jgi:ribosomal-protein-alanine N-acetyltransferase
MLQTSSMDGDQDLLETLETERLRLRCVRPGDANSVSSLMTPEVSRWLISWPVPFTKEMAEERIASARHGVAEGTILPFAIERRSDGAFLGWLSVTHIAERRALLSYWLGEEHHGQGYMREAVTVAIGEAFRLLDVDVIEAAAQPSNGPSLALLRRCGMSPLGERMIFAPARGRNERCVVLELLRLGP